MSIDPPPLRRIGAGFCGSVWADPGSHDPIVSPCSTSSGQRPQVIKREDGGPGRSVQNEYAMHQRLLRALADDKDNTDHGGSASFHVNFPDSYALLAASDPTWSHDLLKRFPAGYTPCNALVNERIPSMPPAVRRLLVERYCPAPFQDSILRDEKNEDCLVRVYLGRRKLAPTASSDNRPSKLNVFSLRNYPLHIDQVRDLGLPAEDYAAAMADALAFMYWRARIDANDVEFVLAPPRQHLAGGGDAAAMGLGLGRHSSSAGGTLFGEQHAMWVLDFDCCGNMTLDEDGVERAAKTFVRNDPYFPRPYGAHFCDVVLWRLFEERFLDRSARMLEGLPEEVRRLPGLFVERVKALSRRVVSRPVLFGESCEACRGVRGVWEGEGREGREGREGPGI